MITVHFYIYNLSINETSYFQQALYNKAKNKNEIEMNKTNITMIYNYLNHFKISNYIMHNTFRSDRCGGGVALYIKQSLQCSLIKQFSTSIPMLLEQLAVEITIHTYLHTHLAALAFRRPLAFTNRTSPLHLPLLRARLSSVRRGRPVSSRIWADHLFGGLPLGLA